MTTRAGEQQDLKIKYLPSGEALGVGVLHTAVWQECMAISIEAKSQGICKIEGACKGVLGG